MGVVQTPDKKLARAGNVRRDVGVHRVLAQEVDAELLARLGEAEERVERDDVREEAPALVKVRHLEELERGFLAARREHAVLGARVKVVDAGVLFVEDLVENAPPDSGGGEHGADDGAELDVAVVELWGDGAGELDLVGLEAGRGLVRSGLGVGEGVTYSYFLVRRSSELRFDTSASCSSSLLTLVCVKSRPIIGL